MFQTGVLFLGHPAGNLISRKILVVKCLPMGLRYVIKLQRITSQNNTQGNFNSLRSYIKYFYKRMLKFLIQWQKICKLYFSLLRKCTFQSVTSSAPEGAGKLQRYFSLSAMKQNPIHSNLTRTYFVIPGDPQKTSRARLHIFS